MRLSTLSDLHLDLDAVAHRIGATRVSFNSRGFLAEGVAGFDAGRVVGV